MILYHNNVKSWVQRARRLEEEAYALYLAYRDPRVPWYARVFALCVAAYAFSPIDLIPDPIPIIGYLDDLIIVPLGVVLALKMIPAGVMAECRARARETMAQGRSAGRIAAAVILLVWLVAAVWLGRLAWRLFYP